ncbi:hypothetical protein L1987_28695 [Smallanthus sonchifolius]|uniref:Uncharacterized protein n=1 Tax=Smallanthus sonchifolius TaxID=185202 RepID=A0ACB9HXB4_9ASTR|nr:hypothetical protein L1987_28695 [Smallanthus sonchifolius]
MPSALHNRFHRSSPSPPHPNSPDPSTGSPPPPPPPPHPHRSSALTSSDSQHWFEAKSSFIFYNPNLQSYQNLKRYDGADTTYALVEHMNSQADLQVMQGLTKINSL